METLNSFFSSPTTAQRRLETHRSPLYVAQGTPSVAISATLSRRSRPITGFLTGNIDLASKLFTAARESPATSRGTGSHIVIVMRANAASGYASALADVARSQNVLEGIKADMDKLGNYLQDKQLFEFLTNPTVSGSDKKSVLKSLTDNGNFVSYTVNLLDLIVDKKRTLILKDIIKEFEGLYNEITDTEVVIVSSAVQINTNQLAQIAMKIQNLSGAKNVRMKNVLDKSLVAGFTIRYGKDGSRFIDMSVKGQLAQISSLIDLGNQQNLSTF